MLETKQEIEEYVNPKLNEGVSFNCHDILMLRHKGNKKLKVFRLEFTWENEGKSMNFSRRVKAIEVERLIDGYIEEVNKLSST